MIEIDERQLAAKPRKVGTLHGKPVMHLLTKGGLHLMATLKGGRIEYLGTGPHIAVCKHITRLKEPDVTFTELSKSDHVDVEHFQEMVPGYQELTERCNELTKLFE